MYDYVDVLRNEDLVLNEDRKQESTDFRRAGTESERDVSIPVSLLFSSLTLLSLTPRENPVLENVLSQTWITATAVPIHFSFPLSRKRTRRREGNQLVAGMEREGLNAASRGRIVSG